MRRHELIDWLFWLILISGLVSVIGLYQCTTWKYFLRSASFIGLGLDAVGALLLVLSEFRPVQNFMWDELVSIIRRLEETNFEREDAHEPWLEPNDEGFQYLVDITRDRRSLSWPHEDEATKVDSFTFWPKGELYAYCSNSNQVTLGPPELVERWVREKADELTRRKIRPYAVTILFIGFGLQLVSYGLQNL